MKNLAKIAALADAGRLSLDAEELAAAFAEIRELALALQAEQDSPATHSKENAAGNRSALVSEFASLQRLALAGESGEVSAQEACRELAGRLPDLLGRALTPPATHSDPFDGLLSAAKEALALLHKGAPGWGVAKDLLNAAIHKAESTS